ncbi:MAG: RNA polymerase sigma factor [Eubacteriales bacterium]|nr:RNA polymerase sigma factor [Eubacteriales bacterium]
MSNDEKKLLEEARQGDEDAFAQLYLRYSPRLYALCYRMCGTDADAQDAVQEAMIKAWRSLGGFHAQSEFGTWLYHIALNCCYDILRRAKRKPVSMDTLQEAGVELPQPGFEEDTVQRAALQQALAALKPQYRAILLLREVQQLSYEEIAHGLGLPVGTVRSRLNRARAQLRTHCEKNGTFSPGAASNEQKGIR